MALPGNTERAGARLTVNIAVIAIGIAFIGIAIAADRQWLDRHFLPPFFVTRSVYVVVAAAMRGLLVIGALLLLRARKQVGDFLARVPIRRLATDTASILVAIVLALGASELVLRLTFRQSSEAQPSTQVPYRQVDSKLGWLFVPGRTSRATVAGRVIEYSFDNSGYRVKHAGDQVDFEKPSILFTGESIMAGQGLNWDETIPAQVQAMLGIPCANLAVHGFSSDQAYLHLTAELPKFRRPLAVVSLFTPQLFDRNMDVDRPHLDPSLVWHPAVPRLRLAMIASWVFPYRQEETVETGISMTRAVFRATADLAHGHGATIFFVVPQFIPEDPTEQILRRKVLDETALPYVWVGLDPKWRIPIDRHPDARGAHAIAVAVADRLRKELRL